MASVQDLEEWMQEAGSALSITLVSPTASGVKPVATFHPKFTYPIFGDDEKIFGYKDLKISLRFRANDMRPHVHTTYSKKLKPAPGVEEPTDVVGVLDEGHHLPKIAFVKGSDFESGSKQLGDNYTPPGKLHATLNGADGQYEVWRGSLDDAAVRQLNTRVQIFVPLFIEGGTYIGQDTESESPDINISDADRWTLFFLYKTQPSDIEPGKKSYIFVGYSTVYRFFFFQPPTPPQSPREDWELPEGHMDLAELPCRTRLSQFIILPPFQGQGNGHLLYKTIFDYYHKHPQTHEFTVENPSEVFDDLRDICDLTFLNTMPEFQALLLDSSVTIPKSGPMPALILGADTIEDVRKKAKIAPRQFARVLEMHLMSQLPPSVRPSLDLDAIVPEPTKADKHKERLWQLIVKQRLYKQNRELLAQIDQSERIEKLRETLTGVELEYARVLAAHERAMSHAETSPRRESNGKRKLDEAEAAEPSKKARVEDE
ncbi:histone acetyltransferase type b catalytic subunit [Purpureocillium lilacinum]|uniref:Histone acetyltransferase type B catalytic subunit n=1 Tax=Purpureocillium lilacinum TaxID=33203 RepID=A0A179HFT6_PURLI|nr:histone acetyltransferase type b catalytic subunit [Purpureocillium lilacinum]OAQ89256.1 histone acetyltransferase type b catalytic subunit [Purpureocillium lilacinum]